MRLKRCGKRFEVACYKNKVYDWRSGAETDLDEVVQTVDVFSNVNKGQFAKTEDLTKAFGTSDKVAICREILAKGDLQVRHAPRRAQFPAPFQALRPRRRTSTCVLTGLGTPHHGDMLPALAHQGLHAWAT